MNAWSISDVHQAFKTWFSKNGNSSTNESFAWACYLAGFEAQINQRPNPCDGCLDARFLQQNEARINELDWMWQRPGGWHGNT